MKLLFTPYSSFISHLTRSLSIAEVLKARGHQVEFMSAEKNSEWIINAGFKSHTVYDIPPHQLIAAGAPNEYVQKFRKSFYSESIPEKFGLIKMVEDDQKIYAKVKPDIIISDLRYTAYETSAVAGIPCIAIENHLPMIPHINSELDIAVESELAKEKLSYGADFKYRLKKALASNPLLPRIIPGIPEFDLLNGFNYFKDLHHCFPGLLSWSGWKKMQKPDVFKYRNKIVILVTLGSTFPFKKVIRKIIDTFKDEKYKLIINTGGQLSIPAEGEHYRNFEILPFISLPDFLKVCDLVIYHGGHGTTMNVLQAGLPGIVIPFNGSQMEISRQIANLNCGIRIRKYPDDVTCADLKNAADKIFSCRLFRMNAHKFMNISKKWIGGDEKAADFIENYMLKTKYREKFVDAFIK